MKITKPNTHTGDVVTRDGTKTVELREAATSWCAGRNEYYDKQTGRRCGSPFDRRRLLLSSVKPLSSKEQAK